MKTTVRNASCTIYTFEDMEIYIIDDRETADVYMKSFDDDSKLIFVFGVESKNIKSLDIERLYEVGFFNNIEYAQDAADFYFKNGAPDFSDDDKEEETK